MSVLRAVLLVGLALGACDQSETDSGSQICSLPCTGEQVCLEGRCVVLDGDFIAVIQPRDGAQEVVPVDGLAPGRPTTIRLPEDCDIRTEVRLRSRTSSTSGSRNELTADLAFHRRDPDFPVHRFVGTTTALPDAAFPSVGPGSDRQVSRIRLSRAEVYDVRVSPRASTAPALFEGLSVTSCPSSGQTFELFPARRISGVVRDALDGLVQANVDVWAIGPDQLQSPVVRSDAAGRFTLDLPRRQTVFRRPEFPAFRYEVRARRATETEPSAPPSWRYRAQVSFEEGQESIEGYEIRLEPTLASLRVPAQFELRGRSVNNQDRPVVQGAELRFQLVNSSTGTAVFSGAGVTEERGRVFTVLPSGEPAGVDAPIPVLAGPLQFSVRPPPGSPFADDILEARLSPTSPLPLQLELTRPRAEARGQLTDSRQAPLDRVLLTFVSTSGRSFSGFSDEAGSFSIFVEPGRYGWSMEAPGDDGLSYGVVNVGAGGIELGRSLAPTAPVELFLQAFDGRPLVDADAWIYVQIAAGDPPIQVARGRSDGEGKLAVRLPLQTQGSGAGDPVQ